MGMDAGFRNQRYATMIKISGNIPTIQIG